MEAVRKRLCPESREKEPPEEVGRHVFPDSIRPIAEQVEAVRGLTFTREVNVETVTREEMGSRIRADIEEIPSGQATRRERVWKVLGILPPDVAIKDEYADLYAGQVVGYYDPATGALVVVGTTNLSVVERLTLAHELTHALDDQHFDLGRLDRLSAACREDAFEAALAAVEGSAQVAATDVLVEYARPGDLLDLIGGEEEIAGLDQLAEAPPFLVEELMFPYLRGEQFMRSLRSNRGPEALNEVLRNLPKTTEQVLHPERYASDRPQVVEIPDLAAGVGAGWDDLDVQDVGEAFLLRMLGLRLDASSAERAAAGWDGGVYRAWRKGEAVVVALATVWDAPAEAREFASALRRYLAGRPAVVWTGGTRVHALVATDRGSLDRFVSVASG